MLGGERKKTIREITGFAVAGGLALSVDLTVFNMLALTGVSLSLANACAVLLGLLVNFVINHYAFLPKRLIREGLAKKSVRFGTLAGVSSLYLLVGFEIALLVLPNEPATTYSLVRILLTGSGTIVRFILLKVWVFRQEESERLFKASQSRSQDG